MLTAITLLLIVCYIPSSESNIHYYEGLLCLWAVLHIALKCWATACLENGSEFICFVGVIFFSSSDYLAVRVYIYNAPTSQLYNTNSSESL